MDNNSNNSDNGNNANNGDNGGGNSGNSRTDTRMDLSYYRSKAKCVEAIRGIILLMKKNKIPIPSKYQRSRVHEDLPNTPQRKEAEIMRRFTYLEPENRDQIAQKLNDLLVYAEVAKLLRSELIAIIVLSKLRKWEHQILHPELEMPPIPIPSPQTQEERHQRQRNIEERDRQIAHAIRQYEEEGQELRGSIQSIGSPKFGDAARTITLPPQTIVPPVPPRTIDEYHHQQQSIQERDRKIAEAIRQHEEQGKQRAAAAGPLQLGNTARTIKLPPQTIVPRVPSRTMDEHLERQRDIEERDRRAAEAIRQFGEQGQHRAAAARPPQFGVNARQITLPQQTIASPHTQMQGAAAPRVDLEEQRRRDLEQYKRFGAIRKRLHELPEYDRDLQGPKLPGHGLGQPTSSANSASQSGERQRKYKELEKQRNMDKLNKLLREAMIPRRRNPNNNNNNDNNDDGDIAPIE